MFKLNWIRKFALTTLIAALLSGCFQNPYSTTAAIRLPEGAGAAAILTSAVEASGRVSGAFDPNASYAQALAASSGAIAGTAVVFPPGALSIAADIYVEHGADLSSSSALADLGLTMSNAVASAGAAAIIRPSTDAELKTPMSLSLPLPAGFSLTGTLGLGDPDERVAILAKIWDPVAKELRAVLIPRAEINVEGGLATFDTMYFGVFQTVVMENPVTTKVEAKASEPVTNDSGIAVVATSGIVPQTSIATTESMRPLTFASFTVSFSSAARAATAQARLSESVATSSCTLSARDKDRGTVVWSTSNNANSASAEQSISAPVTAGITGMLEASMTCIAVDGRSAKSDWQNLARLCPAGKFGPDCVACAAGTAWDVNSSRCEDAGTGYYSTGDGVRRSCNTKPADATFTSTRSTAPSCEFSCNTGFFGPSCSSCAAGTWWDATPASCVNAGLGYYANGDGIRRTCDAKPVESVHTNSQATTPACPFSCNTGFFGADCTACAAGTWWDGNACANAGTGFYSTGNGLRNQCSNKPADASYSSSTATSENCPYACNASRFGPQCVACAAGTWWNPDRSACEDAGQGNYATGDGVKYVCGNKPSNAQYTSATATSSDCPYACVSGFWGTTCVACAAGSYWLDGSGCLAVGAGYYSTGTGVKTACSNKPSNATYTGSGNTSADCAWSCASGYTQTGQTCVAAPPTITTDEIKLLNVSTGALMLAFTTAVDPGGGSVLYDIYRSATNPGNGAFSSISAVEAGTKLASVSRPDGSAEYVFSLSGQTITAGVYYFNIVATTTGGGKSVYRAAGTYIGPTLHWNFNGSNYDTSGFNNAFVTMSGSNTASRTPSTTDRFGTANRAHIFNGSNEWGYSTSYTGISQSQARTLAYWVKPNLTSYNDAKIIAAWGSGTSCGVFGTYVAGNSYAFWRWGGGCDHSTGASIISGTWEHHALTYDGSNFRFYQNGSIKTTITIGGTYTTNGPLTLGTGPAATGSSDSSRYFAGSIDDVFLIPSALSGEQITALYNVTKP